MLVHLKCGEPLMEGQRREEAGENEGADLEDAQLVAEFGPVVAFRSRMITRQRS